MEERPDSQQARAERLIAGGRLTLGLSSLFALWLDPTEPIKLASTAYGLLVAYSLYAFGAVLVAWRFPAWSARWGLVGHAFDLLFFTLFVYFTAGPSSPFFAFFVFSLVVGTVRWQWKGSVWTAVISLASLLAVGVYFSEVRVDPDFELHTFIIRAFYLGVIAGLLAYLGAHEARSRREIEALHVDLAEELARTVAMEERVRLARDLHDGVLQSMTGFGLQLATVRRRLGESPELVAKSLEELQQQIASEQRDLRFFIDEVRPPRGESGVGKPLGDRLRDLADRIEREWGLRVDLEMDEAPSVPEPLGREIYHLAREGLVNAARHAHASSARVELGDPGSGGVEIRVADDGRGFPFRGRFDDRELRDAGDGPRSLLERIQSLGGTMILDSEANGSCLTITLPR